MSFPLPDADATCLVTGASSGIGEEIARELARRGYHLTLTARRKDRLDNLASELSEQFGVTVATVACDLRADDERARLIAEIASSEKRVDVLVNNAGLGGAGKLHKLDPQRAMDMVDTNIRALVALCQHYGKQMVARKEGAILNVASTAAFQPIPGEAVYSASKAFVLNFSEALHTEMARAGVTCTVLCPGPTRTEFAEVAGIGEMFEKVPSFAVASAQDVAVAGVDAMVHGKRTCVPGTFNKISAVAGSKSPRTVVLKSLQTFWPGAK